MSDGGEGAADAESPEAPRGAMRVVRLEGLARSAPRLRHAISTRPWNVSFSVGAEHGDPVEGRRALCAAAGIDPVRTIVAGQVHGKRVAWVTDADAGRGALVRGGAIQETDGLATATPGLGLLITAADCPPVVLYDPQSHALAALHAGWRGTAAGIVASGAALLRERAGSDPARLLAAVGPGIGPCCYEVGEDVLERVPAPWRTRVIRPAARACEGRPRLHLAAWIQLQLLELGIAPEHIEASDACTACRTDLFFSHRGEKGKCGRFGLLAALR